MKNRAAIEGWLKDYLAEHLSLKQAELDSNTKFDELGIDSAAAVEMMGDLETWLGQGELDPTLPYDHPSIGALAGHLATLP